MLKTIKKSITANRIKDNMNEIANILEKLFSTGWMLSVVSALWVAIAETGQFLYDWDHPKMIFAVLCLITIDAITAWYRAHKTDYEIKSDKIQATVLKIMVYMLIVAAGNLADLAIPKVDFVMMWLIGWLALKEFVSIIENFGKAGHGVPKKLLNQLPDYNGSNDNQQL